MSEQAPDQSQPPEESSLDVTSLQGVPAPTEFTEQKEALSRPSDARPKVGGPPQMPFNKVAPDASLQHEKNRKKILG